MKSFCNFSVMTKSPHSCISCRASSKSSQSSSNTNRVVMEFSLHDDTMALMRCPAVLRSWAICIQDTPIHPTPHIARPSSSIVQAIKLPVLMASSLPISLPDYGYLACDFTISAHFEARCLPSRFSPMWPLRISPRILRRKWLKWSKMFLESHQTRWGISAIQFYSNTFIHLTILR